MPSAPADAGARCSSCGATAAGNFCSHCGASLAGARCPACDAPLSPGARFCHLCGTPLGHRRSEPLNRLPWVVAGLSVVILAVVAVLLGRRSESPVAPAPTGVAAPAGRAPAPDISSMSPRQRADALYDRIVAAHESGDTSEIRFFTPMALQAYALLGDLDADARYHVGLIHALTGNPDAALAQADSIQASWPDHLLASLLRHRAAMIRGDAEAGRQAYRMFLDSYEREIAAGRPEYDAHRRLLDSFRQEAERALEERAGP